MSGLQSIEFNTNEFSCIVENDVAILTVKGNAFKSISSVERNSDIIPWLDSIENSHNVRGILTLNEKDAFSEMSYKEFLSEIIGDNFNSENYTGIPKFIKNEIRAREITIIGNMLRKLVRFKKILISGISGDIVSPFFGLSLASDFRFASSETNFVLSHIKYRLHPSGALPFFLPRFLCHSKVIDLLFRGTKVDASTLKKLGLISEYFNESEFIEKTKVEAFEICKVSLNVVQSTKKLLYRHKDDLEDYLNIESKLMMR